MKKSRIFKNLIILLAVTLLCALAAAFAACNLSGKDKDKDKDKGETETVYDLSDESYYVSYDYIDGANKYTGEPIFVDVTVYDGRTVLKELAHDGNDSDLSLTFENNVNAGKARVTITAKPTSTSFKGSRTVEYEIQRSVKEAASYEEICAALSNPNYVTARFTGESFALEAGQDINVPVDTGLDIPCPFTLRGNVTLSERARLYAAADGENYGNIIISTGATFYLGGKDTANDFTNAGSIVNGGTISFLNDHCSMFNTGTLDNAAGKLTSPSPWPTEIYSNSDVLHSSGDGNGVRVYRRRSLSSEAQVELAATSLNYNRVEQTPAVTVRLGSQVIAQKESYTTNYTVEYADNKNVGRAAVTVRAGATSKSVYGEKALSFDINAVPLTATNASELNIGLTDDNYKEIICSVSTNSNLTVGEGKKLVVRSAGGVILGGSITVLGELEIESGAKLTAGIINGKVNNCGTLYIDGDSTFTAGSSNSGGIYCGFNGGVTVQGSLANGGAIYLNSATANIVNNGGGTVTVRRKLDESNVSLVNGSVVYNGEVQQPEFSFGYADVTAADYAYACYYGVYRRDPLNAGDITVEFNAAIESPSFYGSFSLDYCIQKAPNISVTTQNGLTAALDGNYACVTLSSGTLTVYGNVTVPAGVNLIISSGSKYGTASDLSVNGTVTVAGGLYAHAVLGGGSLVLDGGGAYVSSDSAVFEGRSGEGEAVLRKSAASAHYSGFATAADCTLTGAKQETFSFTEFNGAIAEGADYDVTYNNNVHAGSKATFTVTAEPFSKYLYGKLTLSYDVRRADSVTVTTLSEFERALRVTSSYDGDDFKEVNLGADISSTPTSSSSITYKIKGDATLNLCGHTLTLGDCATGAYRRYSYLINDGTVITDYNLSSTVPAPNYSGSGRIVGLMNQANHERLTLRCNHEIWLTEDITPSVNFYLDTTHFVAYSSATHDVTPVIDLCGHSFNGTVRFNPSHDDLIVNSATPGGRIDTVHIYNNMSEQYNVHMVRVSNATVQHTTKERSDYLNYIDYLTA